MQAAQSLEGQGEAFYFSMGERDVVSIVDMPDAVGIAAMSLTPSPAAGIVGRERSTSC